MAPGRLLAASGSADGHAVRSAAVPGRHPGGAQSWDYVVRSGLAGGMAGCAAKTLVAPLDLVKILFQTSKPQFVQYTRSPAGPFRAVSAIYRARGLPGLFQGHSATLLRIFPYASIKFVAYEQFRSVLVQSPDQEVSWRRFLAGSLAGLTSVLATYPLEIIRVRLAFETSSCGRITLTQILSQIYHERPKNGVAGMNTAISVRNFYRGFIPTIAGMFPYAGVSFLVHDIMGDILKSALMAPYTLLPNAKEPTSSTVRHPRPPFRSWAELVAGAVAGLTAQTVSYPLEVVRRRMQIGGAVGQGEFCGFCDTARSIWERSSYRGFFVGLTIGYIKITPMVATSFFVYERLKYYLGI